MGRCGHSYGIVSKQTGACVLPALLLRVSAVKQIRQEMDTLFPGSLSTRLKPFTKRIPGEACAAIGTLQPKESREKGCGSEGFCASTARVAPVRLAQGVDLARESADLEPNSSPVTVVPAGACAWPRTSTSPTGFGHGVIPAADCRISLPIRSQRCCSVQLAAFVKNRKR